MECSIEDCTGKPKARNLCDKHLSRLYRNGSPYIVHQERLGLTETPEYNSWRAMKERCRNPKHPEYGNYGGRGIKICERWMRFSNFLADMGRKPSREYSIERTDNDGNYEPANCIWATRKQQGTNTSTNRIIEFNGVSRTVTQWADSMGMKPATLFARLRYGWSVEDAIRRPVREY